MQEHFTLFFLYLHPSETSLLLIVGDRHLPELIKRLFAELKAIVPRDNYLPLSVNLDLGEDLSIERKIIPSTRKTGIKGLPKVWKKLWKKIYGVSLRHCNMSLEKPCCVGVRDQNHLGTNATIPTPLCADRSQHQAPADSRRRSDQLCKNQNNTFPL